MALSAMQVCKLVAGSAGIGLLGTLLYAMAETRRFQLEVLKIPAGMLEQSGNREPIINRPLRILHLSDLHLKYPDPDKIEFLKRITADRYDLVVLTGDIFENYTALAYADALLSRRPALGAYAVFGNHDYYNYRLFNKTVGRIFHSLRRPGTKRDLEPMIRALSRGGIQVLRNSAVNLPGQRLHIVGIDYPTIERDKLYELAAQARDGDLILALFHLPVCLNRITGAGVHLALGGHTHGGQVRLPGVGAVFTDSELPRHTACGLFVKDGTAFHISQGLGADPRTNIRLFCPPTATVIEVEANRKSG